MTAALSMSGITKRFPGVTALDSVEFGVGSGKVVALVGENGAGKSTLMKILAGILQPDSGTIQIDGQTTVVRSPRDGARQGIGIIHQELELIDTLDIAANLFLGREPVWGGRARLIDTKQIHLKAEDALTRVGLDISSRTLVGSLPIAHKQMVEIARAISLNAKFLIMDEPTSSLTAGETERLFVLVRDLKAGGAGIIYISHRLSEVERLADRVVVLRDGRNAGKLEGSEITHDRMVQFMVGDKGSDPSSPKNGTRGLTLSPHLPELQPEIRCEIKNLRVARYPQSEISLQVRSGEILGLAGLVGAGRTELARAVFGVDRPLSGTVWIAGKPMKAGSPRVAIKQGIYLVPEDRHALGLILGMTVRENVTLPALSKYAPAGWIRRRDENAAATKICDSLHVKTPSLKTSVAALSGGNQQKVVLAKWLSLDPKLILFDEPTRGIDVGAKAEIHQLMRRLADEGVAIIMISSDMEEILGNSDRVAVMREGRITGILERPECSQEAIMRLAVA